MGGRVAIRFQPQSFKQPSAKPDHYDRSPTSPVPSQILPTPLPSTSSAPTRRHPNPHTPRHRARRPRPRRINAALDQTDRGQNPIATTALHPLPGVLADVRAALGALEAAVEFALLELGAHPGQGVEEVVAAGGGGVGGFVFWGSGSEGFVREEVLGGGEWAALRGEGLVNHR